jgi:hypothetical protein
MSVSAAAGTFSVQRGKGTPLITPSDLPPAEHFIDGEFRSGSRGQTADVVDPSNESAFARVVSGTTEDRSGQAGPRLRERVKIWTRRTTPSPGGVRATSSTRWMSTPSRRR